MTMALVWNKTTSKQHIGIAKQQSKVMLQRNGNWVLATIKVKAWNKTTNKRFTGIARLLIVVILKRKIT